MIIRLGKLTVCYNFPKKFFIHIYFWTTLINFMLQNLFNRHMASSNTKNQNNETKSYDSGKILRPGLLQSVITKNLLYFFSSWNLKKHPYNKGKKFDPLILSSYFDHFRAKIYISSHFNVVFESKGGWILHPLSSPGDISGIQKP